MASNALQVTSRSDWTIVRLANAPSNGWVLFIASDGAAFFISSRDCERDAVTTAISSLVTLLDVDDSHERITLVDPPTMKAPT